jgi:Zn finger protein HypA/HybF involved in hydrogenase expression
VPGAYFATVPQNFPCSQCGASLQYAPGTTTLVCPYCRSAQAIPLLGAGTAVEELDFEAALETAAREEGTVEVVTARCRQCSAESSLAPNVTVHKCPFCGTPLSATAGSKRLLRPQSLLPFAIPLERARTSFRDWASGLWFAPSGIAKDARTGAIDGIYLPFWTFDCQTTTTYDGERGDDHRVMRAQSVMENGRSVTRQVEQVETRWSARSGEVQVPFDDVLIAATSSMTVSHLHALEPWDLAKLEPFEERYLTGFRVESWSVPLPTAFEKAKAVMAGVIASVIRSDIGGDHQRIHRSGTKYEAVRFKHLLLPVWMSSYSHGGKVFRFVVNARTGEVQGERPWSAGKIALFVLFLVSVLVVLISLTE